MEVTVLCGVVWKALYGSCKAINTHSAEESCEALKDDRGDDDFTSNDD